MANTARKPTFQAEAHAAHQATADVLPYGLTLELEVTDREVVEALSAFHDEAQRRDYALTALKIGISSLRLASGRLDAELIQRESARLLESVDHRLQQHTRAIHDRINHQLKDYFDPDSGRFNERVNRLVSRDGELEQILRRQIGTQDSEMVRTLVAHVGQNSPLMKSLSPTESEGVIAALRTLVVEQLKNQRERVLDEFSLDNKQGALTRLVSELTKNHGQMQKDLQAKIDEVVKEFSLDQENSALSRLVRNVDSAQRTIVREFSLDNPESAFSRLNTMLRDTQGAIHGNLTLDDKDSPLARLKQELLQLLKDHARDNVEFREEVKATLATLVAKRQEADRSVRHGLEFEAALGEFLARQVAAVGDIFSSTGASVGRIKNCKIGDFVVETGPDCQCPGARIVVEAKEDASYTLPRALEEIQQARKNRDAQIGLFVFSSRSAPDGLDPFARYGDDLVVVWDAEVVESDVYLKAALTTARALCLRSAKQSERDRVDYETIDRAILEIEKRAGSLDDVRKSAQTIHSASQKILTRIERTQDVLQRQVQLLNGKIDEWKQIESAG